MSSYQPQDLTVFLRTTNRLRRSALLVVVVPVLAALSCNGPDPRPMSELVRKGDVFLDPETLQPYSGPIFATFVDQPLVVAARSILREGTYDGPSEEYFGNQLLSSKETYRNGRKHGSYEWYFESGRLFESGTYRMGLLDGPYEAYWETGDLYERGTYRAGQFDGPRAWYLDGELIELVTYVNGEIDGTYERYDEGGSLELSGTLWRGVACGRWIEHGVPVEYPACGVSTE